MYADKEYIIGIRRELHEYPEIGFDLPRTLSLVSARFMSGHHSTLQGHQTQPHCLKMLLFFISEK